MALGLGVFGIATFVYLGVVGRDLGPADYAPVSLAFTLINALGLGLFYPVEQEVACLMASRRAHGAPAPALGHVLRYLGISCLLIAVVAFAARGPISTALLAGEPSLVPVTAAALAAIGVDTSYAGPSRDRAGSFGTGRSWPSTAARTTGRSRSRSSQSRLSARVQARS